MELEFNKFISHYMSERLGRPVTVTSKIIHRSEKTYIQHYLDDVKDDIGLKTNPLFYIYHDGVNAWRLSQFRERDEDADILSELESEEKMYENKRMEALRVSLELKERERRIRRKNAYLKWFKWLCETANKSSGTIRMLKAKMALTVQRSMLDEFGVRLVLPESIDDTAHGIDDRIPESEIPKFEAVKQKIHDDFDEDLDHDDDDEAETDEWLGTIFTFDNVPKTHKHR